MFSLSNRSTSDYEIYLLISHVGKVKLNSMANAEKYCTSVRMRRSRKNKSVHRFCDTEITFNIHRWIQS